MVNKVFAHRVWGTCHEANSYHLYVADASAATPSKSHEPKGMEQPAKKPKEGAKKEKKEKKEKKSKKDKKEKKSKKEKSVSTDED